MIHKLSTYEITFTFQLAITLDLPKFKDVLVKVTAVNGIINKTTLLGNTYVKKVPNWQQNLKQQCNFKRGQQ